MNTSYRPVKMSQPAVKELENHVLRVFTNTNVWIQTWPRSPCAEWKCALQHVVLTAAVMQPLHIHASRMINTTTKRLHGLILFSEPWPRTRRATVTCPGHPQAQVHLFCFNRFCHHQQKSREDNFLELVLAGPLWRYARTGLSLSLSRSFPLGRSALKQVYFPEDPR